VSRVGKMRLGRERHWPWRSRFEPPSAPRAPRKAERSEKQEGSRFSSLPPLAAWMSMFHVEHWHRNSMCHVAHSSHCQCSTWNIDIPRQAGRVGRRGHEVDALQQVQRGRIRNSRPGRHLDERRTLVFSVMLQFVAFRCNSTRPHGRAVGSPPRNREPSAPQRISLHPEAPAAIIPNTCQSVKSVFPLQPVAAGGVNVTRKEACEFDRRPAA